MFMRFKKTCFLWAVLLATCGPVAWAQQTISGFVKEAETSKPLADMHVFILDSTVGTITDRDGKYELKNVPPNAVQIAASGIGYQTDVQRVVPIGGAPLYLDFRLAQSTVRLDDVEIVGLTDKSRREYIKRFMRLFLGTGSFAKSVRFRTLKCCNLPYRLTQTILMRLPMSPFVSETTHSVTMFSTFSTNSSI